MTALSLFIEVALKATLLLAAAGVAAFALRGAAASLRHLIWSWSMVGMLALPALTLVLPRWELGLLAAPDNPTISATSIRATEPPPIADARTDAHDTRVERQLAEVGMEIGKHGLLRLAAEPAGQDGVAFPGARAKPVRCAVGAGRQRCREKVNYWLPF